MHCRECAEARRFAKGSVYCILYGMIIREDYKCTLKGSKRHEGRDDGPDDTAQAEAEIYGQGRETAGEMPGVLQGSGERKGLSGVEGQEGRTA